MSMSTSAAAAARSSGSNWRGGGGWWRRSSAQDGKAASMCSATVTLASSIISSTIWFASRTCRGRCRMTYRISCKHHLPNHLVRLAHLPRGEVVEEDARRLLGQRLLELLDVAHLDVDLRVRIRLTRCPKGRPDAVGQSQVGVLDEHRVIEPHPVVHRAALPGRVLLEGAQPGGRLAGVEDLGLGALDGLDEPRGEAGDAAQMLEEVERHPLAAEHGAGRAEEPGHDLLMVDDAVRVRHKKMAQKIDTAKDSMLLCAPTSM